MRNGTANLDKRTNVLHLIPSFHQGGSERQAIQLVRALSAEGTHTIHVACHDKSGVLLPVIENAGFSDIPAFPLTSFYDANMLRQARSFARLLKEKRIDILQTHDFYSNVFGVFAARFAGVPIRIAAKREIGMRTSAQLFVERRAFSSASRVVVNSEGVRNFLIDTGVKGDRLHLIYNGIEARFDTNGGSEHDANRALFGIPAAGRAVTIVANLRDRVKDHATFLKAAAIVSDQVPEAVFVVAGEGELLEETRNLANELGLGKKMIFTGRCERVPELLSVSDVGVLSSRSEGFSNSIIEYMAAGKPVVATRVGGAAEAIVEGETGFMVDAGDAAAMAKRIVQLLQDPKMAIRMGASGREKVEQKFSAESQLRNTLDLYEAELSRHRRA